MDRPHLTMDMDRPVFSVFIVWLLGVFETAIFVSACKAGSSLASFVGSRELANV